MVQRLQTSIYSHKGHIPTLDGLRASSILIVLLSHLVSNRWPGGYGVFLFFIISGFLITRLMFVEFRKNDTVSLPQFYRRRFFRLYPVIIVYSAIIVLMAFINDGFINYIEPLSALLYFANYYVPYAQMHGLEYQMPFKIFWSLSVEEHFYFVFPLAFVLLRGNPGKIAALAIATCVVALCLRAYFLLAMPPAYHNHYLYMHTEFRMDSIAYGVLLASICELQIGRKLMKIADTYVAAGVAVIMLVIAIILPNLLQEIFRDLLIGLAILIGMSTLLFGSKFSWVARWLNLWPIAWFGKISYSLYVWHIPVHLLIMKYLPGMWIVSFVASTVVAVISYYWVERPFIRLGQRLQFGSPQRASAAGA